jgi:hypothetical protein
VNGGVLVYRSFFPSIDGKPSWDVYGGTSAASPQAAALTAAGNAAREAAGKAPVGDLNQLLYKKDGLGVSGTNDVVPVKQGTVSSGELDDNQIWDLTSDGTVVKDPVPGYPTTAGYDLTTGWGTPNGNAWINGIAAG